MARIRRLAAALGLDRRLLLTIPLALALAALFVPVFAALLQGAGLSTLLKLAALWPVSVLGAALIAPVLVPPGLAGWMLAFALAGRAGLKGASRAGLAGASAGLCAPLILLRDHETGLADYAAVALPCALAAALAAGVIHRPDGPFGKR